MMQKIGICKDCGQSRPLNAKSRCPDCQYLINNGETRFEASIRKQKIKRETQSFQSRGFVKTVKKRTKKKNFIKSKKLEERREILKKDEELYEKVFNSKPHKCEECEKPLPDTFRNFDGAILYRAQYSHILGKGAFPQFRHKLKNMNRLCIDCHNIWDFGDKTQMKIYSANCAIIEELLTYKP